MSLPEPGSVTCRACGHEQPFTAWRSLNVTLDREQKQELLDGRLTSSTCKQCGVTAQITYDLLYHDMAQKLMIQLWPEVGDPPFIRSGRIPVSEDYRLRIVSTIHDLLEKIRLFDQGCDDGDIEIFKVVLWARDGNGEAPPDERLYFRGIEHGENGDDLIVFDHVRKADVERYTFALADYREALAAIRREYKLGAPQPGKWLRVDADFVSAMFEKASPAASTDSTGGPAADARVTLVGEAPTADS